MPKVAISLSLLVAVSPKGPSLSSNLNALKTTFDRLVLPIDPQMGYRVSVTELEKMLC